MEYYNSRKTYMGAVWTEALASIIYCFVASGVVASTYLIPSGKDGLLLPPRLALIALGNGFAYAASIFVTSLGTKEGLGYLNPAVTIAMMCSNPVTKRYSWYQSNAPALMRGTFLMFAQFFGSLVGVLLVMLIVPGSTDSPEALGVPSIVAGATPTSACAFEAIGTFFLTFVVLACECRYPGNARSASAPVAVGFTMVTLVLFAFPFTGACFNPFRAFWLKVCAADFSWDWVPFLFGPVLGSLGAVLVYALGFTNTDILQGKGD
eukprot:g4309.t1